MARVGKEKEKEEGAVVVDLLDRGWQTPYRISQLYSAGAFRKMGGTIALYDLDEPLAHWLKGNEAWRG